MNDELHTAQKKTIDALERLVEEQRKRILELEQAQRLRPADPPVYAPRYPLVQPSPFHPPYPSEPGIWYCGTPDQVRVSFETSTCDNGSRTVSAR